MAALQLHLTEGELTGPAGSQDYDDAGALTAVFSTALKDHGVRRVAVSLGDDIVQSRTLRDLPAVPERDLVKLVDRQRARFFRRPSDDSLLSAAWASSGTSDREAFAAVSPSWRIETLEAAARAHGVTLAVAYEVDAKPKLSFRSPEALRQDLVAERRRAGRAVLAAIAALALLSGAFLGDLAADGRVIRGEVLAVRGSLDLVDSLETQLESFQSLARAAGYGHERRAWASDALIRAVSTVPATDHVVSVDLTPSVAVLEVHTLDPIRTLDALAAALSGSVAFVSDPAPAGEDEPGYLTATIRVER